MSEPGLEPSQEALAVLFPYGRFGQEFGQTDASFALRSIEPGKLQSPRDPRKRWTEADYVSFSYILEVESASRDLHMSPDVPRDRRQPIADELRELLQTFREALPYSEAERRWLVDLDEGLRERFPGYPGAPERVAVIRKTEDEIVSAGLRQVVSGRELTRLWWSWRRQTDEFTGQGSRDIAYGALIGVNRMFSPPIHEVERAGVSYWTYRPPIT